MHVAFTQIPYLSNAIMVLWLLDKN